MVCRSLGRAVWISEIWMYLTRPTRKAVTPKQQDRDHHWPALHEMIDKSLLHGSDFQRVAHGGIQRQSATAGAGQLLDIGDVAFADGDHGGFRRSHLELGDAGGSTLHGWRRGPPARTGRSHLVPAPRLGRGQPPRTSRRRCDSWSRAQGSFNHFHLPGELVRRFEVHIFTDQFRFVDERLVALDFADMNAGFEAAHVLAQQAGEVAILVFAGFDLGVEAFQVEFAVIAQSLGAFGFAPFGLDLVLEGAQLLGQGDLLIGNLLLQLSKLGQRLVQIQLAAFCGLVEVLAGHGKQGCRPKDENSEGS